MIRAVLADFGETLVERISDRAAPLSQLDLKPFADADQALRDLKNAGLLLAIVSNTEQSGDQEMELALEKIALRAYFDVVVTSTTVGYRKPDRRIFYAALDRLRCAASQAVMVGDDPETDIKGAAALGMPTILLRRASGGAREPGATATFTVSSLLDVPALITRLRTPVVDGDAPADNPGHG